MIRQKYMKRLGKFKNVENMISPNGNYIPNQFILFFENGKVFKSYNSIIAIWFHNGDVILGKDWNYSNTTGKYRNIFLGETKADTLIKIKDGIYKVDNKL